LPLGIRKGARLRFYALRTVKTNSDPHTRRSLPESSPQNDTSLMFSRLDLNLKVEAR
jgi:hypothetical protein